jgi:ABC-2 type transport system ATP-binding protein
VILATHDLDEAERVADHAVVLHRGNVVADGRMTDLCAGGKRLEEVVREVTK